jgi:ParB-like chromosome segregation protein Spo0J
MADLILENILVSELKPHPRNYREHPEDQINHLVESIRANGLYRNVVIARDNVVLAGHGILKAVKILGFETIPVYRIDIESDSVQALKIITGDNEIGHLAEIDDRLFTELLKEINDLDVTGLLGTGYDEMMLANLITTVNQTDIESEPPEFQEYTEDIEKEVEFNVCPECGHKWPK